jgi:hypothetical protein
LLPAWLVSWEPALQQLSALQPRENLPLLVAALLLLLLLLTHVHLCLWVREFCWYPLQLLLSHLQCLG